MKHYLVLLFTALWTIAGSAQEVLHGTVSGRESDGTVATLAGASVYWKGTTRGTITDAEGHFHLAFVDTTRVLIVRHAAYAADTLVVGAVSSIAVTLLAVTREVEGLQIIGERAATVIDYMDARSVQRMTQKELAKAACCNLAESFETNPAIDVSFADAITGTRQIEMLGLSGIYTQTTLENLPYIRGLTSNVGLTFIPGTWIKAINVSKGIGSVANGYESITGQIDVDLRKPDDAEERRVAVNVYGNMDARIEGNLVFRQPLGSDWSSMTLMHASSQRVEADRNSDRFLDFPVFTTVNALQRWSYSNPDGWEGQFLLQYVHDTKEGGTGKNMSLPSESVFRFGTTSQYLRLSGKTGHVFEGKPYQSFGIQWSLGRYRNTSSFGPRSYAGIQETGYLNFLYQSILGSTTHGFRTGASILVDRYDESFDLLSFNRTERVPGVFFEYTYRPTDEFSIVAGIRGDYHNAYGTFITPRLHMRYAPDEDWVVRAVAGKGFRTANILTEHASVFASSRTVTILPDGTFGFGLGQEVAWNYGANVTHYFLVGYRQATVSIDFYRTVFSSQVVADLDASPREVRFVTVGPGGFANSLQVELNAQPLPRLETRFAYRYLDVRQQVNGALLQRPLNSQHRALINLAYATEQRQSGDPVTSVDITVQWFGPKRLPSTASNPPGLRGRDRSPAFATLNTQVTRTLLPGLELYVGVENLFDFIQDNPIVDPAHPSSPYFDASLIWGPLSGRMAYAGLRWGI